MKLYRNNLNLGFQHLFIEEGINLKKRNRQNIYVSKNAHSVLSKHWIDLGLHTRERAKLFGHIVQHHGVWMCGAVRPVVHYDVRARERVKLQGYL